MDNPISIIKEILPEAGEKEISDAFGIFNNVEKTIDYLTEKIIAKNEKREEQVEDYSTMLKETEENERLFKEFMAKEQSNLEIKHGAKLHECEICYNELPIQDFYIMDECDHRFCRFCVGSHVNYQISSFSGSQIKCPKLSCRKVLNYDEVKQVLTPSQFKDYEEFTLQSYLLGNSSTRLCPKRHDSTVNCKGVVIASKDECYCPLCYYHFCFDCRGPSHVGITCAEYEVIQREILYYLNQHENDREASRSRSTFDYFRPHYASARFKKHHEQILKSLSVATKNWIRSHTQMCPFCNIFCEKSEGCNDMACLCGNRFCYGCGVSKVAHKGSYPCYRGNY